MFPRQYLQIFLFAALPASETRNVNNNIAHLAHLRSFSSKGFVYKAFASTRSRGAGANVYHFVLCSLFRAIRKGIGIGVEASAASGESLIKIAQHVRK